MNGYKKLEQRIARQASKHSSTSATLEPLYIQLIGLVENIHEWSGDIATALPHNLARHRYSPLDEATMEFLLREMRERPSGPRGGWPRPG